MALVPISLSAPGAVSAPDSDDPALLAAVTALRKGGEVVIRCVGRSPDPRCDRMLVKADDEWVLRPLKS